MDRRISVLLSLLGFVPPDFYIVMVDFRCSYWGGRKRGGRSRKGCSCVLSDGGGASERGVAILLTITIIIIISSGAHAPGFVVCRQRGSHGEFRGALVELSL